MTIVFLIFLLVFTAVIFLTVAAAGAKPYCEGKVHIDTVITVKNAEESIERVIKDISEQRGGEPGCIYVVDLGSTDMTEAVVKLLEHDIPYLHRLPKSKAEDIIEDIGFVE